MVGPSKRSIGGDGWDTGKPSYTVRKKKGRSLLKENAVANAYARARGETTEGAVAYRHGPVNSQESGGNRYK